MIRTSLIEAGLCRNYQNQIYNVEICDNHLVGADYGINLEAAHCFRNEIFPTEIYENTLRNINIFSNIIANMEEAISLRTVCLDGRYDGAMVHLPVSNQTGMLAHDNKIEDIEIYKNKCVSTYLFFSGISAIAAGTTNSKDNICQRVHLDNNQVYRENLAFVHTTLIVNEHGLEDSNVKDNTIEVKVENMITDKKNF